MDFNQQEESVTLKYWFVYFIMANIEKLSNDEMGVVISYMDIDNLYNFAQSSSYRIKKVIYNRYPIQRVVLEDYFIDFTEMLIEKTCCGPVDVSEIVDRTGFLREYVQQNFTNNKRIDINTGNLPNEWLINILKMCEYLSLSKNIKWEICYPNTYSILHKYYGKQISNLNNIVKLDLRNDEGFVTDEMIKDLTNLEDICLSYNHNITNNGIKNLVNLKTLNLTGNKNITNNGIKKMVNLKTLNLDRNTNITNSGLSNMTKIETLYIQQNKTVSYSGIKKCNIKTLHIDNFDIVSICDLKNFHYLNELYICGDKIKKNAEGLDELKLLTKLHIMTNYSPYMFENNYLDKYLDKLEKRNVSITFEER